MIELIGHTGTMMGFIVLFWMISRVYRKERTDAQTEQHFRRIRYLLHVCLPLPLIFAIVCVWIRYNFDLHYVAVYLTLYFWIMGPVIGLAVGILYLIHAVKMKFSTLKCIIAGIFTGVFALWTGLYLYLGVGFATGMIGFM